MIVNNIDELLNPKNINSDDSGLTPTFLPMTPCVIEITLDQVVPFDNPRQSENPKFAEIKASIHNRGLDHPPTITARKPGDPYMISDGGNTRLQILKELYQEYLKKAESAVSHEEKQDFLEKAESFYRHEWRFKPWSSEVHALSGHMSENDQRGSMLFIEKALASLRLKEMLDPNAEMNMRELATAITETGWTVSQSSLSTFLYASTQLVDLIPTALWAGLSRGKVLTILRIRRCFTKYIQTTSITTSTDDFDLIWESVLTRNDDTNLDLQLIRNQLCDDFASKYDLDIFTFRAQIDDYFNDRQPSQPPIPGAVIHKEQPLHQNQTEPTVSEAEKQESFHSDDENDAPVKDLPSNRQSTKKSSNSEPLKQAILTIHHAYYDNQDLNSSMENLLSTANDFFGTDLLDNNS